MINITESQLKQIIKEEFTEVEQLSEILPDMETGRSRGPSQPPAEEGPPPSEITSIPSAIDRIYFHILDNFLEKNELNKGKRNPKVDVHLDGSEKYADPAAGKEAEKVLSDIIDVIQNVLLNMMAKEPVKEPE